MLPSSLAVFGLGGRFPRFRIVFVTGFCRIVSVSSFDVHLKTMGGVLGPYWAKEAGWVERMRLGMMDGRTRERVRIYSFLPTSVRREKSQSKASSSKTRINSRRAHRTPDTALHHSIDVDEAVVVVTDSNF